MDNRDEEDNRSKVATPADNDDRSDWTDSEQDDAYTVSTVPGDDLSKSDEMDFEDPLWGDSEVSDDMTTPGQSDSTQPPEKDWLVDSGLAAAIRPETAERESTIQDDLNEDGEDGKSTHPDSEDELTYADEDIDDEDLEEVDDDLSDFDDDDLDDDDDDLDDDDDDLDDDDEDLDDDHLEDEEDDDAISPGENNDYLASPLGDRGEAMPDASTPRSVWPMLVGLVAVVLISVGGWGLFEERTALQARINDLERSQSQTQSANPVDASVLSALEAHNASLELQLDGLYRDYELAMAELASLQEATEMAVQEAANASDSASTNADKPQASAVTADTESDTEAESNAAGTAGDWFVNVGAYSVPQSAENLAAKLNSGGFDAVVQEISTAEGKQLFRVRVIGLSTKDNAQKVAQDLESSFGIGPVWVGQTPTRP